MAKRLEYRYKGLVYMRPCGRGLCVHSNVGPEPYPGLEDEIGKALNMDDGDFYVEIIARPKPPKGFKPKPSPKVYRKTCCACYSKMHEVHDSMGDSWNCPTCGITEEM
jgi:hypothetical protein